MKNLVSIILILIAMSCTQQTTFNYPETVKGDVMDEYHGTEVQDPYRWLEDDMSDETAAWVKAQNEVTFAYLESIPFRDALKERMTKIWNYPKMGTPFKEGDFYFYSYNTGLQNQSIIYKKKSLEEDGEVFLDPNGFSDNGTVALAGLSFSKDHKYAAYGISKGGSDWKEFFVKEVATGNVLEDHIEWIKNSGVSWFRNGFFYTRYETPAEGDELKGENKNAKIYYHKLGTLQSEDKLVHQDPAYPDRNFYLSVTEDEDYIMLSEYESTSGNSLAFKKAGLDDSPFTWIDKDFDDDWSPIGNQENMLYILTNNDAPLYRLLGIDLNNPGRENWVDIIPEHKQNVLESAKLAGGKIIASYLQDASDVAYVYEMDGSKLHDLSLPGIGALAGFSGKKKDNTAFYTFTSFNYPTTTFKYNIAENISELFYTPEVDFDAEAYDTKQVFYPSKDGTSIPMFIVHKKGIELDGNNPTLLYGYGGFNVSETPYFSTTRAVWMEQGGVFALANIRGGGEYGEAWHKAGTVLQKQNVFDDFIAAAEFLIKEKYTSSKRLAIYGGSNGGLLVGAVINQRPELFAAAIPMVGVMDMLRFHKFTIGRYWTVDYGSSEDPEEFDYLLGYSPIHNISSEKNYPAVLITTGDHDDRVVPAHSFKYAATLQEKYSGKNPVMIRINTDAGHGAGKPTDMVIQEYTDVWSFIYKNLDFTPEF